MHTRLALVGSLAVVSAIVAVSTAVADVRLTWADLNGTRLRIQGTAIANRTITVNGVAMGTSDAAGIAIRCA